jgi:hypothetical protein
MLNGIAYWLNEPWPPPRIPYPPNRVLQGIYDCIDIPALGLLKQRVRGDERRTDCLFIAVTEQRLPLIGIVDFCFRSSGFLINHGDYCSGLGVGFRRPNVLCVSCAEASRACGSSGTSLAATNEWLGGRDLQAA